MKRYPLVDLAAIHDELGDELEAAVLEVIRSHRFIGGEKVAEFERIFADYLGAADAIGVANGTDAIELSLKALNLVPGAEALVPANTFIATAEAVVAAGLVPRFVDVDARSGLLDLASCEERLSERTRVVIPVHLYGRMPDMNELMQFADRHSLTVIEDAAQAHGARREGRFAGTIGHVGCFSFYPGKNLGAFGDAGAVVTGDPGLADRIRLMRDHGRRGRNDHVVVGVNSRLDPIQAAVLTVKLPHLERWNAQRRQAAEWYRAALPADLVDYASNQPESDVHHLFPILTKERDAVAANLAKAGIQTGIHYEHPLPRTPAFSSSDDDCPVAAGRADRQLSLPMHPHLTQVDVEQIANAVTAAMSAPAV
ncbi:MAG: DegT/DnrJ/EryC1/StrS family aminotransferase [Alphaproteobacteria bacterium]|nr:DegT/DnrJ/EryC1/StrS family aminotransferase [Alphaproteobacteria bacterium]